MAHNNNQVRARYRPKAENFMDQVREVIRHHQCGIHTEQIYVRWILEFIRFNGIRHPIEMGKKEIERFFTHLSVNRKVAVPTQREAISAILFLYREVLDSPLDDQIKAVTSEKITLQAPIPNQCEVAPLFSSMAQ